MQKVFGHQTTSKNIWKSLYLDDKKTKNKTYGQMPWELFFTKFFSLFFIDNQYDPLKFHSHKLSQYQ